VVHGVRSASQGFGGGGGDGVFPWGKNSRGGGGDPFRDTSGRQVPTALCGTFAAQKFFSQLKFFKKAF
jgi:hypothetical protein